MANERGATRTSPVGRRGKGDQKVVVEVVEPRHVGLDSVAKGKIDIERHRSVYDGRIEKRLECSQLGIREIPGNADLIASHGAALAPYWQRSRVLGA